MTPIFADLEVLMEVLIPFRMAKIIDVGIQRHNLFYVIKVGAALVIRRCWLCCLARWQVNLLLVMGVGGRTIGTIVAYLQFTKSFTQPFMQVAQQFNSIIMAFAESVSLR